MTKPTARYILKREGISFCSMSELRDLLSDRFNPLQANIKAAIQTLLQ